MTTLPIPPPSYWNSICRVGLTKNYRSYRCQTSVKHVQDMKATSSLRMAIATAAYGEYVEKRRKVYTVISSRGLSRTFALDVHFNPQDILQAQKSESTNVFLHVIELRNKVLVLSTLVPLGKSSFSNAVHEQHTSNNGECDDYADGDHRCSVELSRMSTYGFCIQNGPHLI